MPATPDFTVTVREVEVNTCYRHGINEGYIIAIGFDCYSPIITYGNNHPYPGCVDWEHKIMSCFLDSYTTANICISSHKPVKVRLFVMYPIQEVA